AGSLFDIGGFGGADGLRPEWVPLPGDRVFLAIG
nr:precorrin-6x reductase (EC 1.-.-.-) - Pseudomonas sp. (strain SC510) (fragments) [Pseudomonas sp.]